MTDAETCDKAACNDEAESLMGVIYGSGRLDDDTGNVSKASDDDGRATTIEVCEIASHESACTWSTDGVR